jgi:hypothetical protein
MTSEAGGDAKARQGRRERRQNHLREASATLLAPSQSHSPADPTTARRRIITGTASGCGRG